MGTPIKGKAERTVLDGLEAVPVNATGKDRFVLFDTLKSWILGTFDAITFNTDPPAITTAGTLVWNKQEYTIDIITGLGATIQVGHEMVLLYYNDTGVTIADGSILHPKSGTVVGGLPIPTPELADASKWELSQGTLSVATHDILNGEIGLATRFGRVRGLDTSTFSAGSQLWLSDTTPGMFTDVKPVFPSYSISMGGTLNSDATDGEVFVTVTKSVEDTFNDAWDGAIRESFNFTIDSDGAIVTGTLENIDDTMDLTLLFSDGFYTLDTTTSPLTIVLTAGTDELTTTNYVYIPMATKVLTISTSGFPITEHCKIAQLEVQSAVTVQTKGGARRNQNINDHLKQEDDNGHILHMAERIRQLNAEHDNGTEGSLTGTTANGYIQVTGGQVWQMHKQTFPAISMPTDSILIVNDFTTAYKDITNLDSITAYSTGSSWSNEWSNIVVWGVINKTGEPSFIMGNLPSDGYNSEANAVADASNYTDYSIPNKYKGVGFLIARFTVRISGGTITYNSGVGYQDLRGFIPNNAAGGGVGGGGVTTYLGLTDTPSTRATKAGMVIGSNSGETADEYINTIYGGNASGDDLTFESTSDIVKGDVLIQPNGGNLGLGTTSPAPTFMSSGIALEISSSNASALVIDHTDVFTDQYIGAIEYHKNGDVLAAVAGRTSASSSSKGTLRFLVDDGTSLNSAIIIDENSNVYIMTPPTTDTGTNNILTYNSSTGAIEQRNLNTSTSVASSATPTPTGSAKENEYYLTALAVNATFAAPSGTPVNGNNLIIRIQDNGTARTLAFNAIYEAVGVTLPTTTVLGKKMYIGMIYNSTDSKWDVVSIVNEA